VFDHRLAYEAVAPGLVHKEFEDDVLICNLRGALPNFIEIDLLNNPVLSNSDIELLNRFYKPIGALADVPQAMNSDDGLGSKLYLQCMPAQLSLGDLAQGAPLGTSDSLPLTRHYEVLGGVAWLSQAWMNEVDQVQLMDHFVPRNCWVSDIDRAKVSAVLDKLAVPGRPQSQYSSMVMDTKNYFFYRKHHEHVPGIMMIEVIRQAMYAQYYKFSRFKKGEISLTIENLNVNFMGFVNSNYPCRVMVEDVRSPEQALSDDSEERTATIYQANKPVAVAQMRAKPIKMNLFKRLRNVKPAASIRFIPVKNIASQVAFVNESGAQLEGTLNNLSIDGLNASFTSTPGFSLGGKADLFMFVDGLGFINARLEPRWQQEAGSNVSMGFRITDINQSSAHRLRDAIKNFTFIDTRRAAA
jgi:hypothetical protein